MFRQMVPVLSLLGELSYGTHAVLKALSMNDFSSLSVARHAGSRCAPPSSLFFQSSLRRHLAEAPVIAAVRTMDELSLALRSPARVISMMGGGIGEIERITEEIHGHGKSVLFHPELVKGLGRDPAGVEYLIRIGAPDGIVSTKRQLLQTASQMGVVSVFQVFMIDTQALETGLENLVSRPPDIVEIMPGLMPSVVRRVKAVFGGPVLAAGLIKEPTDVDVLLKAGASGVAASEMSLWTYASSSRR